MLKNMNLSNKLTMLRVLLVPLFIACFYLNGNDMAGHHRVIQFMLDNNLIPKTRTGRLYNMSFKFDDQTHAGEYGADFEGKIKLNQFVNLDTGEWIT